MTVACEAIFNVLLQQAAVFRRAIILAGLAEAPGAIGSTGCKAESRICFSSTFSSTAAVLRRDMMRAGALRAHATSVRFSRLILMHAERT